jgi:hypothetical protein
MFVRDGRVVSVWEMVPCLGGDIESCPLHGVKGLYVPTVKVSASAFAIVCAGDLVTIGRV